MTQALIVHSKQPLMERICDSVAKLDAEIGVDHALLFGSTAKGKRHRNSDVGIIIVSSTFEGMPEPKRWGLLQNMWNYIEELETLAYTPDEFTQVKERFLMQKILAYAVDLTPRKSVAYP